MSDFCANGLNQSPISIKSGSVARCTATCDLTMFYRTSKCNITNTGGEVILDYDPGSYVTYNNTVYELNKISFTIPSSHKIDNYSYPAEIHLYHRSQDTGLILVIAVFLDINDAISPSSMFFETFQNAIPETKGGQNTINTSDNWNAYNVYPEQKAFYAYKGSLVKPPCNENVQWILMENPVNCTVNFFDKLKGILGNNARSIKDTNSRKVFYNPNNSGKNIKNYGDRMKCYTDKEFREQCSRLVGDSDIITARNKQVLLITLTIAILVILALLVMWLIQQDFFTNTKNKLGSFLGIKLFK